MPSFYALKYTDYEYMMLSLDAMDIIRKAPRDQELEFDDIMSFSRRDTQFSPWWRAPETSFIPNSGARNPRVPDIVIWQAGAALVLSPKARRLLGDLLQPHGEFLPVRIMNESDPYWIFNCLSRKDADPTLSAWDNVDGIPLNILSIGFQEEANDPPVFKTDFDNSTSLYCTERFKHALEDFDLKGLTLSPCGEIASLDEEIQKIGN